jgi:hypothetical protein
MNGCQPEIFYPVNQVDTAQSRTSRPTAGAPASQKMEARRLQLLTKQREALEMEVQTLEAEVDTMVRMIRPTVFDANCPQGTSSYKFLTLGLCRDCILIRVFFSSSSNCILIHTHPG